MYISTPASPEVENFQMKIYYPAGDRTPDLLNHRQICYHLSQRGKLSRSSNTIKLFLRNHYHHWLFQMRVQLGCIIICGSGNLIVKTGDIFRACFLKSFYFTQFLRIAIFLKFLYITNSFSNSGYFPSFCAWNIESQNTQLDVFALLCLPISHLSFRNTELSQHLGFNVSQFVK